MVGILTNYFALIKKGLLCLFWCYLVFFYMLCIPFIPLKANDSSQHIHVYTGYYTSCLLNVKQANLLQRPYGVAGDFGFSKWLFLETSWVRGEHGSYNSRSRRLYRTSEKCCQVGWEQMWGWCSRLQRQD